MPVPANPEALTRELADGNIQAPALRKALDEALPGADPEPEPDTSDDDTPPEREPGPSGDPTPEISPRELADALFPRLWQGVRTWAEAAAQREIRRRQGRLD